MNALSKAGSTALKLATLKGHTAIVNLLKANGATGEPTAPTTAEKTTATAKLFTAVKANDVDQANEALEAGADANAKDSDGWTALVIAAGHGRTDIVKALLNKGADINARSRAVDQWTPLMYAAYEGHTDTVKALLAKGVDINAKDTVFSRTALTLATSQGHKDIADLLKKAGETR